MLILSALLKNRKLSDWGMQKSAHVRLVSIHVIASNRIHPDCGSPAGSVWVKLCV
jgi:hypothetical protein